MPCPDGREEPELLRKVRRESLSWPILYFIVRQGVLNALIAHTNLVRKQDAEAAALAEQSDR